MIIKRLTNLLAVVLAFIFFSCQAATAQLAPVFTETEKDFATRYPGYFEINIKSVRHTFKGITEERDMSYVKMAEQNRPLNNILVSIEKIVNIAQKVWSIVEANRPVLNLESKYATAYPEGVSSASQLSSWSKPKVYTYGFYAENLYGGVMINTDYKVIYAYNGTYKGKGKYLTGVAVVPTKAEVSWGYKLYISAAVPDSTVTNVGTDSDPVAAMQLKLDWKIKTVVKESDGASVYYIQGDGRFDEIASPWRSIALTAQQLAPAAPILAPEKVF